ncbi:lef-3 [Hyposidra talaca nucleopolyhedrovirus]|uniref:Lef-3 n=1 Tax=Hyposidra talaca nucleopolyhedrovirus TaxID=1070315 RepID=A0A2Z4HI21_9ABAC|nr:lef-3 [Hyposidra talaca nucleopolyhedrovirus]AWW14423.1 lef-3 [Hyposidra talaca nucleopolyhedrovirus]
MSDYESDCVVEQDEIFGTIEENTLPPVTNRKRKKTSNDYPKKRVAQSPRQDQEENVTKLKRLSVASTSHDNTAVANGTSTVRKNFKRVTGELIGQYTVSLNKNVNYLLKFLVDNVNKQYYSTAEQFQKMKLNVFYDIVLTFENKKIWIESYKECKTKNRKTNVKRYLAPTELEGNDTISVYAKMKHGFKTIDGVFKIVFHILIGDSVEDSTPYEIECASTLNKIIEALKNTSLENDNDLLAYFIKNRDRMYRLCRIKSNLSNTNYKSLIIQSETHFELVDENNDENEENKCNDDMFDFNSDNYDVINLTRKNKRVLSAEVSKVQAEYIDCDKPRLSLNYTPKDSDENVHATLFDNSRNCNKEYASSTKKKNNKFDQLEIEINQMNDLIEDNIYKIYIHVLYDVEKSLYTLLGFTRYEIDCEQYDSL